MNKDMICTVCPRGCQLHVEYTKREDCIVTGNSCPRGIPFAIEEIFDPKRTVTAVVQTDSPIHPYVPVKTKSPVSRKLVSELLKQIYAVKVSLPIKSGDIIIENFNDTGIDVVATRTVS